MWPIQLAFCLLFVGYFSPPWLFVIVLRIMCTKNYKCTLWRPVCKWELVTGGVDCRCVWLVQTSEHNFKFQELNTYRKKNNENWLGKDPDHCRGCPNKSARFNFVINAPFIQKMLIFLFQYKVHILRLIVENNIQQISPMTLHGGQQCAHFKSCSLVGTPHIFNFL
jgi:hypothetical protein